MANWAEVIGGVAVRIIVSNDIPFFVDTTGEWVAAQDNVAAGWLWDGTVWTGPQGQPGQDVVAPPRLVYLMDGAAWVLRFTDNEWDWLNAQRKLTTNAGKQLNKMMDAIRWTNSVDVSAPSMDVFYDWMLAQGIPGGATRIDELRAPV